MIGIPAARTRVAMLEREEAEIIHSTRGEPSEKVKNLRLMNAIVPGIAVT